MAELHLCENLKKYIKNWAVLTNIYLNLNNTVIRVYLSKWCGNCNCWIINNIAELKKFRKLKNISDEKVKLQFVEI